jgi:hypothetical protein
MRERRRKRITVLIRTTRKWTTIAAAVANCQLENNRNVAGRSVNSSPTRRSGFSTAPPGGQKASRDTAAAVHGGNGKPGMGYFLTGGRLLAEC